MLTSLKRVNVVSSVVLSGLQYVFDKAEALTAFNVLNRATISFSPDREGNISLEGMFDQSTIMRGIELRAPSFDA